MPRGLALQNIHFPRSAADLEESRRRLKFEELFTMQLMLLLLKERRRSRPERDFLSAAPLHERGNSDALPKRFLLRYLEGQKPYGKKSRKIWIRKAGNEPSGARRRSGYRKNDSLPCLRCSRPRWRDIRQSMAPTEIVAEQRFPNDPQPFGSVWNPHGMITGALPQKKKKKRSLQWKTERRSASSARTR